MYIDLDIKAGGRPGLRGTAARGRAGKLRLAYRGVASLRSAAFLPTFLR